MCHPPDGHLSVAVVVAVGAAWQANKIGGWTPFPHVKGAEHANKGRGGRKEEEREKRVLRVKNSSNPPPYPACFFPF
jgi:hypothetical protein